MLRVGAGTAYSTPASAEDRLILDNRQRQMIEDQGGERSVIGDTLMQNCMFPF